MEKLKYWFFTVSRGYSVPMSFLNWLIVFTLAAKAQGNLFYGILALIAIVFAHMGTNLFDDCVDYWLKQPKQRCKTQYLENGFTNIKIVFIVTILYFCITSLIGLFFLIKCGITVFYLALLAGITIILYPRLNNFALGELAVGLNFGVLMFAGVYFVMLNTIPLNILLVSLPVSLLTVAVVYVHALMDYDFDINSGKKTLCVLLGSKKNGLFGLMGIYYVTYMMVLLLIYKNVLPVGSIFTLFSLPLVLKLKKQMQIYITELVHDENAFLKNFKTAVDISNIFNIILIIAIMKG